MSLILAEYVDHMGNDMSVANAARVSFDKDASLFSDEANASLIRYLARGMSSKDHKALLHELAKGTGSIEEADKMIRDIRGRATHWTPFAHTAITLRCAAPVPIRTQAYKSKQGFTENEESRRYISSRPELFIPEHFRAAPEGSIKQGSGGIHPDSDKWLEIYKVRCTEAIDEYERMIAAGISPEQARFILPQGVIVNWIWTGNLYAYANFVNKRKDPHSQMEIQGFARDISNIMEKLYPVSWEALTGK